MFNKKNYKTPINKKSSLIEKKNSTIKSLTEVECFLNNIKKIKKGINLYKFFN